MNLDIGKVFEELVAWFAGLPLAQKIAIPLLLTGAVFTLVFVSRWASQPEYRVLFSDLEEADAAAVIEKLKDDKIAYKVRADGSTIDVTPPEIVDEIRLELASAGLPRGGSVGYEIFNESSLGQTGFAERLKSTRALQGELERTIQAIEGVANARVHVTKPEGSVFVRNKIKPTASVLIRMKAGAELTGRQVKGIANLVANSVESLQAEDVSIVDSRGNLLNEKRSMEETGGADLTRLEYQRSIENGYIKRIETMLSEILGPGKGVARVTAELDFNKYEKEEEAFDPAGVVTRSERLVSEGGSVSTEGGVPGVLSNLTNDNDLISPPNSGLGSSSRKEQVKNYELSRAVSRTVAAAGKINRLTVAVLVDGTYGLTPEGIADTSTYEPLSPQKLRKIENLVKQSVGFDASRGDVVTVENMKFFGGDTLLEQALAESSAPWQSYIPAVFSLLALGALVMMLRPIIKFIVTPSDGEVDLTRLLPAGIEELEAELEAERKRLSVVPTTEEPVVDIEELEKMLAENSKAVAENPQQAALLVRYWINDSQS